MVVSIALGAAAARAEISLRKSAILGRRGESAEWSQSREGPVSSPEPPKGSSRLRILVISQVPPPVHGSTLMTAFLIDLLRERGDLVRLVDRRFSRSVSEIGRFSLRKVMSAAALPIRLLFSLLVFRPDAVIFFATNRTFSFLVDVVMSAVLRITRAKKIFYLHTRGFSSLRERSPIFRRLVRGLFDTADVVVCLGPSLAADVAGVWSGPIALIPNATQPPTELPSQDGSHVLYLSNLIPEKGRTYLSPWQTV